MAKGTLTRKKAIEKYRKKRGKSPSHRLQLFLTHFLDPKSETFKDIPSSARRAKFSESYSKNLSHLNPHWIQEIKQEISSESLVSKAEKHFDEVLDIPNRQQVMGPFGPLWEGKGKKKKPIMGYHMGVVKQKNDISKFVAEMLASKKYRTEPDKTMPPLQTLIIINAPNGETNRIHAVTKAVGSPSVIGGQNDD